MIVWLVALSLVLAGVAEASTISALVRDQRNEPVADAVVVALPRGGVPSVPARTGRETVDQVDKEFIPYVTAVLVGSPVYFPNRDNIRHHVYSFSAAKTFELPLYSGTPAKPIVFDRPGVVTLGCNIHDWMLGYIYVAPTPYFATTRQGRVKLDDLPVGTYTARVWHPRMEGSEEGTAKAVTVGNGATEVVWQLTLKEDLRPRRAPVPGQRGYR